MSEYSFKNEEKKKAYYNNSDMLEIVDMKKVYYTAITDRFYNVVKNLLDALQDTANTFRNVLLSEYNGKVSSYKIVIEIPTEMYQILHIYGFRNSSGVRINNYAIAKPSSVIDKFIIRVYINNTIYKKYVLPLTEN